MRAELARFAAVGAVGFCVDAGIMQLLFSVAGWSPFLARAVSFPMALAATFALNRAWTFRALRMPLAHAYGTYSAIQVIGAVINLSVFSLCLLLVPALRAWPVVALAVGAGVSLLFNFCATRTLVFRA